MLFKPTVITAAPPRRHVATQAVFSLHRGRSQRAIVRVVPCGPLYCVEWPDIGLSPPANLTRCKDAAREWAEPRAVIEDRKSNAARRLKSLNFFWRSSSYIAQKLAAVP
jgi:hypothetical protein